MNKKLFVILYNLIIVATFFLLAEMATRWLKPEIQQQGLTRHLIADSIYSATRGLRPGTTGKTNGAAVTVNHYGFRTTGREVDTGKAGWLLLGDSVTFGLGVEDDSVFTTLLQAKVDSFNIFNPSVPGYNINNYMNILNSLMVQQRHNLNIRRVTVLWCLNDIYKDVADFEMPGGTIRYLLSDVLRYLRGNSRFYYFVKTQVFDRSKNYYEFDKSLYDINNPDFEHAAGNIRSMQQICVQRGIELELVLLPYEYQLRTGDFAPQELLIGALGKSLHIRDAANWLKKVPGDPRQLYLYGDGIHFSNSGHRHVADFLLANMRTLQ